MVTATRISQQQLESYLWGAATLLRGTIDAGDYKQFIFPLLFYKRLCDVFDEETSSALAESGGDVVFAAYPENHRFQVPPEAHWQSVRLVASNVGHTLQSAMRSIETANPDRLYGIFGDAQWTNKDRLPDSMLRNMIEHFSSLDLTVANLPEDELGQGYEFLIKKFADDAGHTAAEFYTNRTVVHLMTEMLEPRSGESVYDPTCGSGGMLLSCISRLRRNGQEWRNVRLYGQERNLMTSSIARMNLFLHGVEDFQIVRGDTLSEPKLVSGDRLMQFDVVLANPPYSIKQWDRAAFASDPWGRNLYGTPPQGRADYAFWQHIIRSLTPENGRCAILFPHGVLFRKEEAEMRRRLVEADLVECVLGLGPDLFYNATMEACIVICRTMKPASRRGQVLFINAVNEFTRERNQSFLTDEHIGHIVSAYREFHNEPGFARVVSLVEVGKNEHILKINLYVAAPSASNGKHDVSSGDNHQESFADSVSAWTESRVQTREALWNLLPDLKVSTRQTGELAIRTVANLGRQFDRGTWTRVRFGDVVNCLKESVDPNSGEVDRYIAGEHMDSENVHLRRWGLIGDGYLGPAFIRRFRAGQVLYGSRRTYLKKVAFAEFDGVTANTTLVLEGVPGRLYQRLLPWLMLSNQFTHHSVRESKVGTNPYINYSDIAKFEFDLPPLDQQRRIADLLWALDEAAFASHLLSEFIEQHLRSRVLEVMSASVFTSGSPHSSTSLGELFDERRENGYESLPILAVTINGQVVPRDSLGRNVIDNTGTEKYLRVCPGDIAYNTMRMWQGSCGVVQEEGIISSAYTVLVPRPNVADSTFWNYAFHTPVMLDWFRRFSTGVASDRWRLYYRNFAKIPARIPPLSMQHRCVEAFACSERAAAEASNHARQLSMVLQSLVNAFTDRAQELESTGFAQSIGATGRGSHDSRRDI